MSYIYRTFNFFIGHNMALKKLLTVFTLTSGIICGTAFSMENEVLLTLSNKTSKKASVSIDGSGCDRLGYFRNALMNYDLEPGQTFTLIIDTLPSVFKAKNYGGKSLICSYNGFFTIDNISYAIWEADPHAHLSLIVNKLTGTYDLEDDEKIRSKKLILCGFPEN